jgi:hypothetical protein
MNAKWRTAAEVKQKQLFQALPWPERSKIDMGAEFQLTRRTTIMVLMF